MRYFVEREDGELGMGGRTQWERVPSSIFATMAGAKLQARVLEHASEDGRAFRVVTETGRVLFNTLHDY